MAPVFITFRPLPLLPQVRCCDGSCVWIGQLLYVEPKLSGKLTCTNSASIKLPAQQVLSQTSPATELQHIPGPNKAAPIAFGTRPQTFQQVYTWQVRIVCGLSK